MVLGDAVSKLETFVWTLNHISRFIASVMDQSVDTFEQNKRFLLAFFRNFKKHLFCR